MQSMAPPQRYVERDNFRRVVCAAVLLVFLLCTLWTVTGCARPAAPPDQLDTGRRNGASECFPYAAPDRFYNDLFTRGDGGWTGEYTTHLSEERAESSPVQPALKRRHITVAISASRSAAQPVRCLCGWPLIRFDTAMSFHAIPMRNPVPSALEQASFAAQRLA